MLMGINCNSISPRAFFRLTYQLRKKFNILPRILRLSVFFASLSSAFPFRMVGSRKIESFAKEFCKGIGRLKYRCIILHIGHKLVAYETGPNERNAKPHVVPGPLPYFSICNGIVPFGLWSFGKRKFA